MATYTNYNLVQNSDDVVNYASISDEILGEYAGEAFGWATKMGRKIQTSNVGLKREMKKQKKYLDKRLSACHSEDDVTALHMFIEKQKMAWEKKVNGAEIRDKSVLTEWIAMLDDYEKKIESLHVANEKLSTLLLDRPDGKTMVLYHGSDKKFDVVLANSVNMGNRLEPKHLSSFWAKTFDYAAVYAFDWMCIECKIPYAHDLSDATIVFPDEVNDKGEGILTFIKREINERPIYVYEAEIPVKYIGRGQVPINEYTVDRDVVPRKSKELKYNDVKKYIKIVPRNEFEIIRQKYNFSKGSLNWKEKIIFRNPDRTMQKRVKNYNKYASSLGNKKRAFFNKQIISN